MPRIEPITEKSNSTKYSAAAIHSFTSSLLDPAMKGTLLIYLLSFNAFSKPTFGITIPSLVSNGTSLDLSE